ncbi:hypothetical protein [Bacterioplanoides pacificum]|uniref:LemA family protein n=1 Tax=Bacterioplanoides pacificum TaxID=1171596 RepID=A0ABV7VSZ5_9GAMM
MSAIGLVVAIALPVMLVLLGLVVAGRRQQAQHQKRSQARAIKTAADDLLEALEFLMLVDGFKELQLVVLDRVAYFYQRYQQALPENDTLQSRDELDVEQYRQKIEAAGRVRKVLKSDREIRYAKQQFSRILKALGPMARQKMISETAMMEYRRYLRITLLEREVDTYTAQGEVAAKRADVVTATNYYKAAKKLLIEFDIQYPEKNDRIRDLTARAAALYNGEPHKEDALSRALSKEEDAHGKDEFGIPRDPAAEQKQKF